MEGTRIQFGTPSSRVSRHGGMVSRLRVEGMTCGNCARRVTDALAAIPGVARVDVRLGEGSASVTWKAGEAGAGESLVRALKAAGYPARPWRGDAGDGTGPADGGAPRWDAAVTVGLPAMAVLGTGDWVLGLGMNRGFQGFAAVVAGMVAWVLGRPFVRGAWAQLKAGGANMDTLVSLGMTAALGYSVPALMLGWHGHLFFTEVVSLLALVGTGHHLERRMSERAGTALKALMTLAPQRARRLAADGREDEVPVDLVAPGDRLLLKPGDRVPVDARIVEGRGSLDESLLTGESAPVLRGVGDMLCTGTTNVDGRLVVRAESVGEETALARITDIVRRAQSTRASVQRLADRTSAVFVPVVVVVALASALAWGLAPSWMAEWHGVISRALWTAHLPGTPWATGVYVGCAVLVVACPCAMGLATPVALMAGVNAAARRGILVRDAAALETCGRVDTVLLDKTGTLTEGRPVVVRREVLRGGPIAGAPAEAWAASMASASAHPLAMALAGLDSARVSLEDWREEAGMGVQGRGAGHVWRLGSAAWLREASVVMDPGVAGIVTRLLEEGATPVLLAMDTEVVAAFGLRDVLRPDARALVLKLRARGLRVGMVSGDREEVALAVGREAGMDPGEVRAGVRPEGKVACIESARRACRVVAFVGDGNNDGPALAAADLGIAVSRATDVAREAAGIVLLGDRLGAVEEAVDMAGATLRTIRQNLFWAFFYNAAAVPLAAAGMVSPAVCAAAMGLSDLVVVGNALRLARRARVVSQQPMAWGCSTKAMGRRVTTEPTRSGP